MGTQLITVGRTGLAVKCNTVSSDRSSSCIDHAVYLYISCEIDEKIDEPGDAAKPKRTIDMASFAKTKSTWLAVRIPDASNT